MRKNLHKISLLFGLFLLFMGTAQSQNGELILATPDLSTWTCEIGETNTFIWKYNYTLDGFDKQCDDINPSSVDLTFGDPSAVEIVGGPSVSGCFVSLNFKCLTDDPLDMMICVNALDVFQANGVDNDDPADDGVGCFDLMSFTVPVEMVFFNAELNNSKVVLNWQTASEIDNEGFKIEKSSDGNTFTELGFVNSTRSTGIKDYRYVDNNPINGVNYYRLKQMDYNGEFAYTDVISVKNANKVSPISIYPNPVSINESVNVFVDSNKEEVAQVKVYSTTGAVISSNNHNLGSGLNKVRIDTGNMPEGLYIISIEMGTERFNKRLIIQ